MKWKAQIKDSWANNAVELLIYREAEGGVVVAEIEATITDKKYGELDPISKPSLVLSRDIARTLLPSLLDALSKRGIKLPDQSFGEGKLVAIEKHLEDMRSLVFTKKRT